jgi:LPS export ABC transporter protein LptC
MPFRFRALSPRRRARLGLGMALVFILGAIGIQLARSQWQQHLRGLRNARLDFLPEAAQRIQNFRRVKVEKGRTVWQITAKDAQYYDQTGEIVVREPDMTFFLADGRQAHITGSEGRLTMSGARELDSLKLVGSVRVTLDDLELRTDEATYDHTRDLITSAAPVTVTGRTMEVQGRGMEVEVGPQHVRLLADVRTVVKNDATRS